MPLHNWSRVESGIFHAFHSSWITEIQNSLNAGRLPEGYYALVEQHAGDYVADVLALHIPPDPEQLEPDMPLPDMPIFLNPDRYVNVPLEATYLEAWKGMPAFWRNVVCHDAPPS